RYAFRTPALRNVDLTGPWMHDGAYTTLEAAVRHYIDVPQALAGYDVSQLPPDLQPTYQGDAPTISAILATLDSRVADPLDLSDGDITRIVGFLRSLTDPAALDLSAQVPASVPSGLPVGD
ncbi:MAG: cytochrome-c peroxidase, partial [Gemmatimonadales bacterium]